MTFGEKLKNLRKTAEMSQEQLAEKLYVSRQAITKWENGTGLPDIENVVAIGALFNESLDNLLSEEKSLLTKHDFLYESRTEYDLDEDKRIDFKFKNVHELIVESSTAEKIEIILASNKIAQLHQLAKVKIEESSKRMDVTVKTSSELTATLAKQELFVLVKIPQKFVAHVELNGTAETLRIRDIVFDNLEYGGRLQNAFITNAQGHIELDVPFTDITAEADCFKGKIDFNQIRAASVLSVKNGRYYLRRVGLKNRFLDGDGKIISLSKSKIDKNWKSFNSDEHYDFIAEVAGISSEITVIS